MHLTRHFAWLFLHSVVHPAQKTTMPGAVAIRNPLVLELIEEELANGAGRNATEVAENLIVAQSTQRRLNRVRSLPGSTVAAESKSAASLEPPHKRAG